MSYTWSSPLLRHRFITFGALIVGCTMCTQQSHPTNVPTQDFLRQHIQYILRCGQGQHSRTIHENVDTTTLRCIQLQRTVISGRISTPTQHNSVHATFTVQLPSRRRSSSQFNKLPKDLANKVRRTHVARRKLKRLLRLNWGRQARQVPTRGKCCVARDTRRRYWRPIIKLIYSRKLLRMCLCANAYNDAYTTFLVSVCVNIFGAAQRARAHAAEKCRKERWFLWTRFSPPSYCVKCERDRMKITQIEWAKGSAYIEQSAYKLWHYWIGYVSIPIPYRIGLHIFKLETTKTFAGNYL